MEIMESILTYQKLKEEVNKWNILDIEIWLLILSLEITFPEEKVLY